MTEQKSISWKDLPGNKFVKGLKPAMNSEAGYIYSQRVKANQHQRGGLANVKYDKEYLVGYLFARIIKPLSILGKERIDELIDEAWAIYCKESIDPRADIAS